MLQPVSDRLASQSELGKLLKAGDRGSGIDDLMLTNQRRQRQIENPAFACISNPTGRAVAAPFAPRTVERSTDGLGAGLDHRLGLARLRRDDRGDGGFQNSSLLTGDGCDRVAEKGLMVERD